MHGYGIWAAVPVTNTYVSYVRDTRDVLDMAAGMSQLYFIFFKIMKMAGTQLVHGLCPK